MKKVIISLLYAVLTFGISVSAQKPAFFVWCKDAESPNVSQYSANFERWVASKISDAFLCARVNTETILKNRLQMEKENQLNGTSEGMEGAFSSSLSCDYLVMCRMTEVNSNLLYLQIECLDRKKAQAFVNADGSYSTTMDYNGIAESCKAVTEKFIKELSKHEICAFTGSVTITQNSTLDSTNTLDYGVYCNEQDQRYHKNIEIHNNTYSEWNLQRLGIPWTEGDMTFSTNEYSRIEEQDGCHKCSTSNREGGWSYTSESSLKVKGSGISHESMRNGQPQDDTRIELKFLGSEKYLVIAKGTSQPVTGEDKVTSHAEGTCDNQPQKTDPKQREIKVPLMVIFGPYSGKATDKHLQEKDTKEYKDPVTNEKYTITIDFSLTQNEK